VLDQRRIPGTSLSVLVREIGRDEPLVSFNASVPRNPASTMKVVTTYAALELLGPAYSWRTRAWATGPVKDLVLDGHLVLEGGGDPFMTADRWWGFVNGLRQVGIERVTGDVVIDNTYFQYQGDDRAAFDNRPYRSYNVLPDALMVNFQTVNVSVVPDATSGAVRARVNPWPANMVVENSVRLERGPCRRGSGGVVVAMPDGPSGNRLNLGGHYASGCGPLSVTRAVMRAPDFAFGTFKTYWQQSGGKLDGGMRLGPVPADARLVYTHEVADARRSDPPRQQVLEQRDGSPPAAHDRRRESWPAGHDGRGRARHRRVLASRGIPTRDLVIENGSGLSRTERISAQGLADVLLDAWKSPYAPEFQASLPLSAVDGTLRRRFRSPDMEGRLRMKTGSLQDVSALAGYVNAASGKTLRRRDHPQPPERRTRCGRGRAGRAGQLGVRQLTRSRLSVAPRFPRAARRRRAAASPRAWTRSRRRAGSASGNRVAGRP